MTTHLEGYVGCLYAGYITLRLCVRRHTGGRVAMAGMASGIPVWRMEQTNKQTSLSDRKFVLVYIPVMGFIGIRIHIQIHVCIRIRFNIHIRIDKIKNTNFRYW